MEQHTADVVEGDAWSPQSAVLIGPMVGLVVAAVALVAYGWLNRTPEMPLAQNFSSISSMLWRTSAVVAGSVVLVALYLLVGRVYRRSQERRTKFLALTAPALLVLAFAGVQALGGGGVEQAFDAAGNAQLALRPLAITTLARAAWWCACLALCALAVASIVAYLTDPTGRPPRFSGRVAAGVIAVVVAVALTSIVVWRAHTSPFESQTAAPVDAPMLTEIRGEVAYRADATPRATSDWPGGAGFVRVAGPKDGDAERVEGFDGATGEKRWSFSTPKLDISGMHATGTGPGSLALVRTYAPTKSLLGIDATTGAVLWGRSADDVIDDDFVVSPTVALFASDVVDDDAGSPGGVRRWLAVSPRTGEVMWTKVFARDCYTRLWVTDNAVLMRTCEDGTEVIARVLEPQTGDERSIVTAASLGIDTARLRPGDLPKVEDTAGDRAIVGSAVVDVMTGQVIARIRDGREASFIDSDSVLVAGSAPGQKDVKPVTILDLSDGATIPTGLFLTSMKAEEVWGPVARVGNQYFAMLQDAQGQWKQGSIVAKSGAVTAVANLCEDRRPDTPSVVAVPGAVLVDCDTSSLAGVE